MKRSFNYNSVESIVENNIDSIELWKSYNEEGKLIKTIKNLEKPCVVL